MFGNQNIFTNDWYWSSTEYDASSSWYVSFTGGDVYKRQEWQSLSTTVVNDNYSHSVVIRPASLGLEHGLSLIHIYEEQYAR